jgi:hypothetical protein
MGISYTTHFNIAPWKEMQSIESEEHAGQKVGPTQPI